ncbi:hypothetical protein BDV36DRAFT_290509 [Aspergillus pseudocaelatus]|uniref:HNH nuclease domain-containing protein n=1 Tax=Aspergillus pseudocaelatus TaxID=1825620 RepID=A0ABQ6X250_9EURO|nr:hypothetical protein BDV36DRAFT_290509 [Aspergillus pseudocaelatus]
MEDTESNVPPTTVPQKRKHSEAIKDMCLERDRYCCITKRDEPVDVAHIYPYTMMGRHWYEQHQFWLNLSCFWAPGKVERWKQVVSGLEGTEVLQNVLCLSCDCHGLWRKARFALQPVELSKDRNLLKARFF